MQCLLTVAGALVTPCGGIFPVGEGLPFACNASCFYAVTFRVSTAETAPLLPCKGSFAAVIYYDMMS